MKNLVLSNSPRGGGREKRKLVNDRVDQMVGVLVAFLFDTAKVKERELVFQGRKTSF